MKYFKLIKNYFYQIIYSIKKRFGIVPKDFSTMITNMSDEEFEKFMENHLILKSKYI